MSDETEIERLRAGLQKVIDFYQRQSDSYRPGASATELSSMWRDGHIAASASCSLIAQEALDPEGWAEHEEDMRAASWGDDRHWFERTGHCGHCGQLASHCCCTDDDPCDCGPHEPSAWPLECWACGGTGQQDPRKPKEAVS